MGGRYRRSYTDADDIDGGIDGVDDRGDGVDDRGDGDADETGSSRFRLFPFPVGRCSRGRANRRDDAGDRLEAPSVRADDHDPGGHDSNGSPDALLTPPPAPIRLTPLVASDPATDEEILWHIARFCPQLRRWIVANSAASPLLLEYVSQQGGPGVREALQMLFDSFDSLRSDDC